MRGESLVFGRVRSFAVATLAAAVVCTASVAGGGPLLIRVERQAPDDLAGLLDAGIPVVMELSACLLVEGTEEHLRRLDALGREATILDDRAATSDYLVAGLRPDSDLDAAHALGTTVHQEENWVLLRVPRGASLETLAGARMFVTRVSHETLRPPRPAPRLPVAAPALRTDGIAAADPLVQKIVDQVDVAQIDLFWQDLTANPPTGTRYSTHQGCRDAATYCHDAYVGWGVPVEYQEWNASHAPNVVATWTGALRPDEIWIIEGHLDDLPSSPPAPGADDNASGSVVVLEAARVMSCWAFRDTVRYLNVTGEESGLNGSTAYAEAALQNGDNILGVLNLDMPGWEGDGIPDPENLDVSYNDPSQWLGLAFAAAADSYSTGLSVDAFYCPSLTASDHYPFWQRGYPAIIGITDNENYCGHGGNYPYYHQSDDTIANCGDPSFFYSVVRTSVATLAELAGPFKVTFGQPAYGCGAGLGLLVGDRDLDADPGLPETVTVELWSDSEPVPELVTLNERAASSMIFEASFPTTAGPAVPGDGLLSVSPGDTVSARYVDALDCDGSSSVPYTGLASIDCAQPVISAVGEQDVTDTSATIVWTTDEDASSVVYWGETTPPAGSSEEPGLVTGHGVALSGLQACTVYYYSVESADVAGNLALDDNAGAYHHFETYGDFGAGLQPCHEGRVAIDAPSFSCSDTLTFRVTDLDLNSDALTAESVALRVTSSTETTPETVTATETGPNTSVFAGSIPFAPGAPAPDGLLQVGDGDVLTVTYHDGDDGTGRPAVSFDVATADCAGPAIRDLHVTDVTDQRLTVRFDTNEPADAVVEWGATPALGQVAADPALATTHAVTLNRLSICEPLYLRVTSSDGDGNTAVADLAGQPYAAHTWDIPGLYWRETFEGDTSGWSLDGEWEIGAPQGLGGSAGLPDPPGAYNHDFALGHDLSGLGARPGDYEHAVLEAASSPDLDARGWTDTRLLLYRQLNVRGDDQSEILFVIRNQEHPVYSSAGQQISQSGYAFQAWDVGPIVDGERSVTLAFLQRSDPQGPFFDDGVASGWNVDDVILKDGTLPDYAACGGCATAPAFSGAGAALDDDACAAGGVTVTWEPAVSWGTGGGGSYAVYRGLAPDFVPSGANLVASGIAALSWNDAAAPTDVDLYYVVRAENDEACGTGPANGGLIDDNLVRAHVSETTDRPLPGAVTTLGASLVNHAHVRLGWTAAAGAASYRNYRSDSPLPATFAPIAETAELSWEDLNQGAGAGSSYYSVRALNACGVEGP